MTDHTQPFAPHAVEVFHTTGRRKRFVRWLVSVSLLLNVGLAALIVFDQANRCLP